MRRGEAAPAPVERGPDGENGRYTLNRISDSFLRLDTRTGHWPTIDWPEERRPLRRGRAGVG